MYAIYIFRLVGLYTTSRSYASTHTLQRIPTEYVQYKLKSQYNRSCKVAASSRRTCVCGSGLSPGSTSAASIHVCSKLFVSKLPSVRDQIILDCCNMQKDGANHDVNQTKSKRGYY